MLILFSLASCGSKPENAIIGKWEALEDNENTEFSKDGTLNVNNGYYVVSYKVLDNEHLKIRLDYVGIIKFKVSKNELILKWEQGGEEKSTKYKRIK